MSITQNLSRVRFESGAKNGTLGTQGTLNADQIKFDTAITTNNGDLETSPSFKWRHVILRRGGVDEEYGLIQSVEVDGLTCNMYADWDSAPASGDTYDIGYKLEDAQTIAGCDFETDSRQWVMTKKLVVGITTTTFGFLGISHGQIIRMQDSGALDSACQVNIAGWLMIGTEKQLSSGETKAERGAVMIFTNDADGENVMELDGVGRLFEFAMHSARAPDGVTGLTVTHGTSSDVVWSRFQSSGMSTPYTKRVERLRERWATGTVNDLVLTVADVKNMAFYGGWCHSEADQVIREAIVGKADATNVYITVED